ncbi:MAG TPA: energy transducer TonB [Terriglobales bacterium]|nr:energy transducer TonB [Terriglobales bacterium]
MHDENQDRIVYVHGDRIRTELINTGRANIRECDLGRVVQLNPSTKTYRVVPLQSRTPVEPARDGAVSEPRGCHMTRRRVLEETGEVQQLLGMQAQHIRIFIYMDPTTESCPPHLRSSLVEQRDGWYIEIPPLPECPARSERNPPYDAPDRYVRSDGSITPELLPVKVEVKVRRGQELHTESAAEVSGFSTEPLDPALFEIPSDYHPVPVADCSKGNPVIATLDDGTPVYHTGCGIAPPRVIYQVAPDYSERARKKKISGTVIISVVVDTKGAVRDVKVERVLEASLDEQAIAAIKQWKFEPATRDGKPVAVQVSIEINFNLGM